MGDVMLDKGCIGELPMFVGDEEYVVKIQSAEISSQQHDDGSAELIIEYDVFKDGVLVSLTEEIQKQADDNINVLLKRFFDDLIKKGGDQNETSTQETLD